MKRKTFLLLAALVLPIATFLFLKFFGKNEFAVAPLFQDAVPSTGCGYQYELPYVVPDSLTAPPGKELLVMTFLGNQKNDEADKLINRLRALFPEDPVAFRKMNENASRDNYVMLRECVFLLPENLSVTVVDRAGRIRGQYDADSMEDVDRLIVELKIILRKF